MLKIVKAGSLTVGVGVMVRRGVVAWLKLHQPDPATVASTGKPVVLDSSATPTPSSSSSDLHVASPESVAATGGGTNALLGGGGGASGTPSGNSGGTSSGSGAGSSGSSADSSLPTPDKFKQYDQYKSNENALFGDIEVGNGPAVQAGSTVAVQYRGWLTDGKLFDESYSRNSPYIFKEGEHKVIPGWEEGLMGMKVGGKRRLIIPPALGYGPAGRDPIPPDALLVFDVELVAVQ